jgi:hypothetical protein
MSMDYPEYEKLRKTSRGLGWLWRICDWGCYLGIFGAMAPPLVLMYCHFFPVKRRLDWDKACLISSGLILFWLGCLRLQQFAVQQGERLRGER